MELGKIEKGMQSPYTALLYCAPGVGKSTALGLIAENSEGNTLVLDVDRTIEKTLAKGEVVKNLDHIYTNKIDNIHTFEDWTKKLASVTPEWLAENDIKTVCVDNISELERCILSDLGAQGKNKGVPAQADYQYMQFKLVNSLRYMKSWGVNIVWTAWETTADIVNIDGTKYTRIVPKISNKIVDNICGLCDVVGKILAKQDGTRGIVLEATPTIYAKNQIDTRKGCLVEEFVNFEVNKEDK